MMIATVHDSVPIFLFSALGLFLCAAPVLWARWTLQGSRRELIAAAALTAVLSIALVAGEQVAGLARSCRLRPSSPRPSPANTSESGAGRATAVRDRLRRLAALPADAHRLRARDRLDQLLPRRLRVPLVGSGRGESNPHLWLGKPASWPLDNARGSAEVYRPTTTLQRVRPRVYWPVTLAAAALVALLTYGVASVGPDTSLDSALRDGKRVEAPVKDLPRLAAAARRRSPTRPARWSC